MSTAILSKMLSKIGVKSPEELDPKEREDFDRWKSILSNGEMSVEKIASFCRSQISIIESQWRDKTALDFSPLQNERRVILHTVYKAILGAIEGPQVEREALEKYLNNLLQS